MSIKLSDGSAGGGQVNRLHMYYFLLIHLNFIASHAPPPSFHCPSSFPLTNSTKAIVLDGYDVMGESSVGWGASCSVGERNGDARAVDFSSALSPAVCVHDGPAEANFGLLFLEQVHVSLLFCGVALSRAAQQQHNNQQ